MDAARPPFSVVNGRPSYINVLDAVGAWALVREAARLLGRPAAASFKHVSPAGAAVSGPVDAVMACTYGLADVPVSAMTGAYVRARDADPKSSYGDFVAVSEPVDAQLADLLHRVVCDGVIAPGFEPGVVASLAAKKRGTFLVLKADPGYRPPAVETREVYGLRLTQPRDEPTIRREDLLALAPDLSANAVDDLLLGLVVARFRLRRGDPVHRQHRRGPRPRGPSRRRNRRIHPG
jgi:phosphoribosylaminoimidazolecarboxamide formyltransferase / IMP cyclohydrolase